MCFLFERLRANVSLLVSGQNNTVPGNFKFIDFIKIDKSINFAESQPAGVETSVANIIKIIKQIKRLRDMLVSRFDGFSKSTRSHIFLFQDQQHF